MYYPVLKRSRKYFSIPWTRYDKTDRLTLSFISRNTNGYRLLAVFDINPALIGQEMAGVKIHALDELEAFCAVHKPVVAVLCVPRQSAIEVSDELVRLGIQGFWNFSHYDLSVKYPDVTVENVHLGDSLMSLGYRLRERSEQNGPEL